MSRYPEHRYHRPPGTLPARREMTIPPFAELDPGIRELVRLLWIAGFNPTDSGDGVTKPDDERSVEGPHVFMVPCDPYDAWAEADRLHEFVVRVLGYWVDAIGMPVGQQPMITLEVMYDPASGTSVLALQGIDDAMLRAGGRARLLFPANEEQR